MTARHLRRRIRDAAELDVVHLEARDALELEHRDRRAGLVLAKVTGRRRASATKSAMLRTFGMEGPTGKPMRNSEVVPRMSKLSKGL